ncbi:hypothetical protein [Winogradskyella sp. A3E31]|uniref:hypothetical protein n=1 Tax=Winogradskyella sp. A3E31 TaxID=3349637 RepID=UPI00398AA783
MKNAVIILVFMFSLGAFAQKGNTETKVTPNTIEVKGVETAAVKKMSTIKAKVIQIDQKKSNDIISIKAYRKSLNVKLKTKRLC